jgi:glycosyltransferase involved in cell wall biosynthesis
MPSVTVIVPTCDREHLLAEALESALAQTYDDHVILVGDNSEEDATEHLIESIGDPRIRYHRNRPGLGSQGNWLDLVRRADTPLVASLHDDDRWHPDFLGTVVPPMLAEPDVGMTFTDFWLIDQDGNRLEEYTEAESARTHRSMLPEGRVDYDLAHGLRLIAVWNAPQPAYAAVLRQDLVAAMDFPEPISPLYDIWISYQMVKQGVGLRYEPRRLTEYRVHPGAATSAGFAKAEDEVFQRIVDENRDRNVIDEVASYWATLRWSRGTRLMTVDEPDRPESQKELLASADALRGPRKVMAAVGGRSAMAWHGLRLGRLAAHRVRSAGGDDVRYVSSQGEEERSE